MEQKSSQTSAVWLPGGVTAADVTGGKEGERRRKPSWCWAVPAPSPPSQRCCLRSHIRYAAGPPSGDVGNSKPQLFHSFLFKSFLLKLQHVNACPQKDVPSSANLLLRHNPRQYHKLLAALLARVVPKAHSRLRSSFGRNQHTVSGWPPMAAARPCPSPTLASQSTAPCCTRRSLGVLGPLHTGHAVKTSLCRCLETSLRALQLLTTNPKRCSLQ